MKPARWPLGYHGSAPARSGQVVGPIVPRRPDSVNAVSIVLCTMADHSTLLTPDLRPATVGGFANLIAMLELPVNSLAPASFALRRLVGLRYVMVALLVAAALISRYALSTPVPLGYVIAGVATLLVVNAAVHRRVCARRRLAGAASFPHLRVRGTGAHCRPLFHGRPDEPAGLALSAPAHGRGQRSHAPTDVDPGAHRRTLLLAAARAVRALRSA